jgi:periplasmic protein TonB
MKDQIRNSAAEDWKDVVSGFYDKSLALAILFILFALIVSPKYQVKPYEVVIENPVGIDWTPEPLPTIPRPVLQRPNVEILIDDVIDTGSDEIPTVSSIPVTVLDPSEDRVIPTSLNIIKNTYYENPPVTLKSVNPIYPRFYKETKVEGTVVLEAELLADGTIGRIEVFKSIAPGPNGLDESAINALRQWKFKPAQVNNNPVTIWVKLPFVFELD